MANVPIAALRLEDLNNRPGISMDGYQAELIPWVTGASNMGTTFLKGTVYACLLKAVTIATDNVLPDMGAVAYETEATGDMLLVIGKPVQKFV